MNNISTSGRPFHNQSMAEQFSVKFIKERGIVSELVLEEAYEEYLREMYGNYDAIFDADAELVCNDLKDRKNKILENLSNHGVYEMDHDILTLDIRQANQLQYKTPAGLKFHGRWFMTRAKAEYYGYPVHNTVAWDNNINRLSK